MKNIKLTLSDTNYTERAKTGLKLNDGQLKMFKELIQRIEGGLFEQRAAYLDIQGLFKNPVKLTITEIEQSHGV
jgi:hypothetical protein